jgi:hypothetical protein
LVGQPGGSGHFGFSYTEDDLKELEEESLPLADAVGVFPAQGFNICPRVRGQQRGVRDGRRSLPQQNGGKECSSVFKQGVDDGAVRHGTAIALRRHVLEDLSELLEVGDLAPAVGEVLEG